MVDTGKFAILGVQINAIDYPSVVQQVIDAAQEGQSFGVTALAVHGVMTGALDQVQRARLNALDMAVPDGQPVRWALKWLHGVTLPDRVYGPTLMIKVCEAAAANNLPIYLYGSNEQVLDSLMSRLSTTIPNLQIAGHQPSRFRTLTPDEQQEAIAQIIDSGAKLVFVGLGCPRQEVWAYEHLNKLPMPMLAVGAAFDFHAGNKAQAPAWMQKRGLEWLFRLSKEPRRLWKRYLLLNPAYLTLVLLQQLKVYRIKVEAGRPPETDIRYG